MSSSLLLQIPKTNSLTPSFRAFLYGTTDSLHRAFSRRRPWAELVDLSSFSRPDSFSYATMRIRKNISYFRINYLSLLGGVLAFSLFSHPLSLVFLILLLSAWLFLYFFKPPEQPLVLFNRNLSNHETLAGLVVATVVVVFFTSVGSLVVSSVFIGGVIVSIHGAFRDPEDLFMDSRDELSTAGFFSMANGDSASSALQNVISMV